MNSLVRFTATTLFGAAIGGGLALMYSPSSGTRNRRVIANRYKRLRREMDHLSLVVAEQADRIKKEVLESVNRVKDEVRQSASAVAT